MQRAVASYKKKDGTLSVDEDHKYLFWTAAIPASALPTITIPVAGIANLQQTPVTNPKVSLKIVTTRPGSTDLDNHVFTFTSASNAREEQGQITAVLRDAIAVLKSTIAPVGQQQTTTNGAKEAVTQAVTAGAVRGQADDGWYDDDKLKADINLQRSLLETNPSLRQRFTESSKERPDSLTLSQFSAQFWSARLHLLRAHAIEKAQSKGDYNVLPEIKKKSVPSTKEGEPDIQTFELSREQIKLLFKQYPIIRTAYNENVPKVDINTFWTEFFNSRLLKKLRGHRLTDQDKASSIFDRYLDHRETGPVPSIQVSHFIDLEGNEQDHSQRKGNLPDATMRPGSHDKVPVLRMLNGLSEKLLSSVARAEGDKHAPIGMDEETYNQLQLRDLQAYEGDNRVKMNIKDQHRLQSGVGDGQLSADAAVYARQSPARVLAQLNDIMSASALGGTGGKGSGLDEVVGALSESEGSDNEAENAASGNDEKAAEFSSSSALNLVSSSLSQSIRARKLADLANTASTCGLSQNSFDELTMTQNTTVEFLHFFWSVFLSGDGSRTTELAKLVETLDKSVDRINAVARRAEEERKARVQALEQQIQAAKQGSAKRRRLEIERGSVGGGDQAVRQVLGPTMASLSEATNQYRHAFEVQSAAAAA